MKKHHGTIAELTFFKTVPNHVATADLAICGHTTGVSTCTFDLTKRKDRKIL